jgi:hypothetical protein
MMEETMAVLDIDKRLGTVLAVGVGAAVLAPLVSPAVARVTRPVLKSAIKGGLLAYEKAKVLGAEALETIEDLAAEAKAELAQQQRAAEDAAQAMGENKK